MTLSSLLSSGFSFFFSKRINFHFIISQSLGIKAITQYIKQKFQNVVYVLVLTLSSSNHCLLNWSLKITSGTRKWGATQSARATTSARRAGPAPSSSVSTPAPGRAASGPSAAWRTTRPSARARPASPATPSSSAAVSSHVSRSTVQSCWLRLRYYGLESAHHFHRDYTKMKIISFLKRYCVILMSTNESNVNYECISTLCFRKYGHLKFNSRLKSMVDPGDHFEVTGCLPVTISNPTFNWLWNCPVRKCYQPMIPKYILTDCSGKISTAIRMHSLEK